MNVVLAETAGFCMGVHMALNKLDSLLAERAGEPIYILGPIIHNPQVLEEYARKGVITAASPDDIPAGAKAVIRAHGVPRPVEVRLRERGVKLLDATCPKVKRAQTLIGKHATDGRLLLLYGEETHPEVKGLLSYAASGAYVFETPEALETFPIEPRTAYCLAAQTTQDKVVFEALATKLRNRGDLDLVVLKTICDATRDRQDEAVRIAREVELLIVVGGKESGNTRRLARVALDQGTPSIHVETEDELDAEVLKQHKTIGLTAGASTPKRIIDDVHQFLKSLNGD